MIKNLTHQGKPARNMTNHQLNTFLSQNFDKNTNNEKNSSNFHFKTLNKESTPKNKENSSYLNERTIDTTLPPKNPIPKSTSKNSLPQTGIKSHLYNFIKDSKDLKLSRVNIKSSIRPQSTNVKKIEKPQTSLNKSQSLLDRSKKTLNHSQSMEIVQATNKSFQQNVGCLESLIQEIKMRGFEKYKSQIDSKLTMKKQLEIYVENLQKKVNFFNSQKKHYGTKNSKYEVETYQYKEIAERHARDLFFMQKEIPSLKQEIEQINSEFGNRIKETKVITTLIAEEDRDINLIKESIRKLNKKISDIVKEKESFRNGSALLKKHIAVLREKIKVGDEKCKEFLLNVTDFVNKSLN